MKNIILSYMINIVHRIRKIIFKYTYISP